MNNANNIARLIADTLASATLADYIAEHAAHVDASAPVTLAPSALPARAPWQWDNEKIAVTIMAHNMEAGRACPIAARVLERLGA